MATDLKFVIEKLANGDIKGGKAIKQAITDLNDGRWTISISKYRKSRSTKQNSVLHWYINEIAEETGMRTDIIKEILKKKFLTTTVLDVYGEVVVEEKTGEVLEYVRSTTDLNTIEFNEFTESIRLWANDFLGLQLPLPNEETELKFK